jgi:hypothetical protein
MKLYTIFFNLELDWRAAVAIAVAFAIYSIR